MLTGMPATGAKATADADLSPRSTTADAAFGHTTDEALKPAIAASSEGRVVTLPLVAGMDGILATGRGRHTVDVSCLVAPTASTGDTTDKPIVAIATHAATNRDRCITTGPPRGVPAMPDDMT
jgi:hypothetical protein